LEERWFWLQIISLHSLTKWKKVSICLSAIKRTKTHRRCPTHSKYTVQSRSCRNLGLKKDIAVQGISDIWDSVPKVSKEQKQSSWEKSDLKPARLETGKKGLWRFPSKLDWDAQFLYPWKTEQDKVGLKRGRWGGNYMPGLGSRVGSSGRVEWRKWDLICLLTLRGCSL
jgi:hypothetical protein